MNWDATQTPILAIDGLSVAIATRHGTVAAVSDVTIGVAPGEIVGIVGESGSGKSVTALAVMGILPRSAKVTTGRIRFAGDALNVRGGSRRGREGLAIIFQNPRSALNPIRPVGRQIVDALRVHSDLSPRAAKAQAIGLLDQVRIREPARRFWSYPFELSGGMCQRVMIAVALSCEPRLLIADEPTTGLDVTTQKAIIDLLVELAQSRGMATVLITHDLALAGERCARLVVMRGGRVVESGPTASILARPIELYTRSLVAAARLSRAPADAETHGRDELLEVGGLTRVFRLKPAASRLRQAVSRLTGTQVEEVGIVRAVDDVSFTVAVGESVGLVGESGSGKSTLASLLVRLIDPTAGDIRFSGDNIGAIAARKFARHPRRSDIQMVFQDPTASLNPRQTAFAAVAEPIRRLGRLDRGRSLAMTVGELAEMVGLPAVLLKRLPHQLSGGEKARVGIARAIALRPRLLVLDEPTAALDVRVQAVVLDLLADLRRQFGMTYLFVSHDLAVVRHVCDRVMVMHAGRIVDSGPTERLLTAPTHPYTRELVAAIPKPATGTSAAQSDRISS